MDVIERSEVRKNVEGFIDLSIGTLCASEDLRKKKEHDVGFFT